jgi:hypothetical protein
LFLLGQSPFVVIATYNCCFQITKNTKDVHIFITSGGQTVIFKGINKQKIPRPQWNGNPQTRETEKAHNIILHAVYNPIHMNLYHTEYVKSLSM